jgi:dimethylaniline monooxygenase (N-oxide forming)
VWLRDLATFLVCKSDDVMIDTIVIGAGPGGIVCTKELLEHGVSNTLCIEQSDRMGGVFAKGYDHLLLTSSAVFSMFSDFWIGDGKDNHFWTKDEVVEYWSRYADQYGVKQQVRFRSSVSKATIDEGGWKINLESGEILQSKRLVLAIGNNNVPRYPTWRQSLSDVVVVHSRDYRNASPFEGKRVLIVGGGESGSDIALEISKVAAQSWVSLRESTGWVVPRKRGEHAADISTHRGIWDLPRDYGVLLSKFLIELERARKDPVFDVVVSLNERIRNPKGIWGTYGTKTLALPQAVAHHGCKVVGDIVDIREGGRFLHTSEGIELENVDAVVFCTGYSNSVPFMPEELQLGDPRSLYKHMFHTKLRDSLAVVGWARPAFGSQFPIMEMQSRFCAGVFSGKLTLPGSAEMERVASLDRAMYLEQFMDTAQNIRSLVDYHYFMNGLAKIIGCAPPLAEYFFLRPKLWLHLMYGPTQATQFRLSGPGKKPELAQEILKKLPISTFNPVVKAGLRGRVRYGLRALLPRFIERR